MNYEIKEMLENKTVFKIVWIFIFAIILGFVRVVYNEIKTPYAIFRSLFLSVCAALIVWIVAYDYGLTYIQVVLVAWFSSFFGIAFWDFVSNIWKELPWLIKEIILSKIWK